MKRISHYAADDEEEDGGGGFGDGWASEDDEGGSGRTMVPVLDGMDEWGAPIINLNQHELQQQQPLLGDPNAIRPEEQVIDNTAYYNLVSLWTSIYINAKEGFGMPIVFDAKAQQMVRNKKTVFDF